MQNYNVINYVYTCNVYYYELIMSFGKKDCFLITMKIYICALFEIYK